jgi:hypothetical protein
MLYFREGDEIELWFKSRMWQLRLLDNTPVALATVLRIVKHYLPHKCRTAQEFIRLIAE